MGLARAISSSRESSSSRLPLSTGTSESRTCLYLDFTFGAAATEVRVTTTLFEFAVVRLMALDDVETESEAAFF